MKFICSQQQLSKGINIISKALTNRTTIPILRGILLEVSDDGYLKMTASDLDLTIEHKIKVTNYEKGSIVIPARPFTDMVRKFPNNEVEFIEENNNISIKCLNSELHEMGMDSNEFPNIKNTDSDNQVLCVDKEIFKDLIKKTAFSASTDISRGVFTGILIDITLDEMKMIAIDGFRMAIAKKDMTSLNNQQVIISAKIMAEINKIISENDNSPDINFIIDEKSSIFIIDDTKIVTRIIDGEFIKYEDIIPKNNKIAVRVRKNDLLDSIERASLLSKEGKSNMVKLDIKDHVITITSESDEGRVKEEVLVEKNGNNLEIGFNPRYLIDVIKVIDDEEFYMYFDTGVSACLIEPVEGDDYKYLVLPVKLNN